MTDRRKSGGRVSAVSVALGLVLFAGSAALAQVTPLDPVPYDDPRIDAHEAALLRSTESRLRIRLRSLQRVGEIFNGECASVEVGTAAYANCQNRFNQLTGFRHAYKDDAEGFNVMLSVALGSASTADPSGDGGESPADSNVINARITIHKGTIWRSNRDSFGAPFAPGEEVRTSPDALVDIVFPNGDIIRLHGDTEFRFVEPGEDEPENFIDRLGDIFLKKGKILSIQRCLTDRHSCRRTRTPVAINAVRGTSYELAVGDGGRSVLSVFEGIVEVTLLTDGTVLEVGEFRQLIIEADGAAGAISDLDPLVQDGWWHR